MSSRAHDHPGGAGSPCRPAGSPSAATWSTEPSSAPSPGWASSASWTCGSKAPSVSISVRPWRSTSRAASDGRAGRPPRASPPRAPRPPRAPARDRRARAAARSTAARSRAGSAPHARGRSACGSCRSRPRGAGRIVRSRGGFLRRRLLDRFLDSSSTGSSIARSSMRAPRSRGLRLFLLVDDLVVSVLDDFVLGGRVAVAGRLGLRLGGRLGVEHVRQLPRRLVQSSVFCRISFRRSTRASRAAP